jgi:hypothetical protein
MDPVDRDKFPDYYELIETPMCLTDIAKKLGNLPLNCLYNDTHAFVADVQLLFANAFKYSFNDRMVYGSVFLAAEHLQSLFEYKCAEIEVGNGNPTRGVDGAIKLPDFCVVCWKNGNAEDFEECVTCKQSFHPKCQFDEGSGSGGACYTVLCPLCREHKTAAGVSTRERVSFVLKVLLLKCTSPSRPAHAMYQLLMKLQSSMTDELYTNTLKFVCELKTTLACFLDKHSKDPNYINFGLALRGEVLSLQTHHLSAENKDCTPATTAAAIAVATDAATTTDAATAATSCMYARIYMCLYMSTCL